MNLTGTGTWPRGSSRMAHPGTRLRVIAMALAMFGLSWGAIAVLGEPNCAAFSERETRELSGLPIPPACVSGRVAPDSPVERLRSDLGRLQPFTGATP